MTDSQRFKNLVYELARTNLLIADLVSHLKQSEHLPPAVADNLLHVCVQSQRRLKQLEPREDRL